MFGSLQVRKRKKEEQRRKVAFVTWKMPKLAKILEHSTNTRQVYNCIKWIDSMLPCVLSVTDDRRRQNLVTISVKHSPTAPVPLFCSYHILTSSVMECSIFLSVVIKKSFTSKLCRWILKRAFFPHHKKPINSKTHQWTQEFHFWNFLLNSESVPLFLLLSSAFFSQWGPITTQTTKIWLTLKRTSLALMHDFDRRANFTAKPRL